MGRSLAAGRAYPLGASCVGGGTNFSVWSRTLAQLDLLLFDDVDDAAPSRVITLDRQTNRTAYYWHAFVPDVASGQVYAWRVHDTSTVLLDPYGVAVAVPTAYERMAGTGAQLDSSTAMKSVVADLDGYDWEGDRPLGRPFARTVIYELHVRGFTAHPNSGVAQELAGTFAGLVEKIPYLRSLGITAVELMPVLAFDPQDAPRGLVNYWGYSPVSFFAPHAAYASSGDALGALDEFRDMVKKLHRAGIEVIIDVVFNHTAEGGADGPTFCWRGLDNETYYIRDPNRRATYLDVTGCGNTVNANNSVVRRMIIDAVRHWVDRMHVDGFRFDLASALTRDERGVPMADPPIIWEIESDPVLAGTKVIAEAWDVAGLYQLGSFVGDRWREWNGKFRDDIRRFVRGDGGTVALLPNRLLGSPDLFGHRPAEVEHSINFVTCHDGFTLNDLVSYARKHNEANLAQNRDGADDNHSTNCGAEGPSDDPSIEHLRTRLVKNMLGITLIAMGVPMIVMGDEVRRTQLGNNNPYCQDNETSWFDWSLTDRYADIRRFTEKLIDVRLELDMTQVMHGLPLREFLTRSLVQFHGRRLYQPDWSENSRMLALTVRSVIGTRMVHAILNSSDVTVDFELPPVVTPELPWRRVVDTALDPPDDVADLVSAQPISGTTYLVGARSVVLLCADLHGG
ncbi:glycogen debranching protein GlgX [Mycolicibacterium psychrotolerans]|uniref:Glycogen operon protein GlgX homolog n=1 Tax=Mycolicibacterium psychrotolerans TaxID=216929 RepID=A0A7I7MHS4_9MYCO|nr:glycogen debranching protein GlgX [Mycolicibacterium psychrotolerans]BBX71676.1 glycogen operon protein GlgX homolog [Mycolicibacterium psychrotolerans]